MYPKNTNKINNYFQTQYFIFLQILYFSFVNKITDFADQQSETIG